MSTFLVPPANAAAADLFSRSCKCSATCTQETNRTFAQGHDARMVSILVAEVLAGTNTVAGGVEAIRKVGATDALVAKFVTAVQNAVTKAQAKRDRRAAKVEAKPAITRADVVVRAKVGRWVRDGQVIDGAFHYTDKQEREQVATKFTLV